MSHAQPSPSPSRPDPSPEPLHPGSVAPGLTLVEPARRDAAPGPAPAPAARRVLIAHGECLAAAGLRALVQAGTADQAHVLAVASTGEDALMAVRAMRPDVVVLDVGLPGCDPLELTRTIVSGTGTASGAPGVLLLMAGDDRAAVVGALRAGARGLLGKDDAPDELLHALGAVADGKSHVAPSIAGCLVDAVLDRPDHLDRHPAELEELTHREREIMAHAAWGLSNDQIAERLVISPATVKTHVSRAMLKLHAHDRAQLVALAYQSGLVTAGGREARSLAAERIAGHPAHAGPPPRGPAGAARSLKLVRAACASV